MFKIENWYIPVQNIAREFIFVKCSDRPGEISVSVDVHIHRFKGGEFDFEVSGNGFHVKSLFRRVEVDGKHTDNFSALPDGIRKVAFDFADKSRNLFTGCKLPVNGLDLGVDA